MRPPFWVVKTFQFSPRCNRKSRASSTDFQVTFPCTGSLVRLVRGSAAPDGRPPDERNCSHGVGRRLTIPSRYSKVRQIVRPKHLSSCRGETAKMYTLIEYAVCLLVIRC